MTFASLSRALTLASACFACSSEAGLAPTSNLTPVAEIVDPIPGVSDPRADPAVVVVEGGGPVPCAGALVGPDVVLTARHCVSAVEAGTSCRPAGAGPLGPQTPPLVAMHIIDGDTGATSFVHVQRILVPPGAELCGADVALVLLDQSFDDIQPLAIRSTGVALGDHVRTVGFRWVAGAGAPAVKWVRDHIAVLETSPTEVRLRESSSDDAWGGPAIDESTGDVVAVVSRNDPKWRATLATRTDAFLAFIEGGLVLSGASPRAHGARKITKGPIDMGANCGGAPDCASGVCVTEGIQRYCSRTCAAHDRCPAGFRCEKSVQTEMVCVRR